MKKTYILLTLLFISCVLNAQQIINGYNFKLNKKSSLFEIVDQKTEELLLYYIDPENVKVYKTDKSFIITDSLNLEKPQKEYNKYLGHCKTDKDYSLYWSNSKKSTIYHQSFNFETGKKNFQTTYLSLKDEKIITSFSTGNHFYLLSIEKNNNNLNFYKFSSSSYEKKSILINDTFHLSDSDTNSLWEVFRAGSVPSFEIQSIYPDIRTEIPLTKNKRKLYINSDKQLVISFDFHPGFSQFIKIDLENFTYKLSECMKTILPPSFDGEIQETNTFVCNNNIFQINSNSEIILIDIKNSESELLKSYKIEKEKTADFLNSNLTYRSGPLNTSTLKNTSQFIKKISNLTLGLSVILNDGIYELTFGGFSEITNNNNAMMYGGMFGLTGSLLTVALDSSISKQNIDSNSNRTIVYAKSFLDQNLNHDKKITFRRSATESLSDFLVDNTDLVNPLIFNIKNKCYLMGYRPDSKRLVFFGFGDFLEK